MTRFWYFASEVNGINMDIWYAIYLYTRWNKRHWNGW